MAILTIRIDEKLKNKATKVFAKIGIDISTAIRLFLAQTVIEGKIPFEVKMTDYKKN